MKSRCRGASSNNDVPSTSNVPQVAIVVWIIAAAATIGEAYNFTVRGDCELGLCLTMMFTVEEYAALLLASKLVKVKKKCLAVELLHLAFYFRMEEGRS